MLYSDNKVKAISAKLFELLSKVQLYNPLVFMTSLVIFWTNFCQQVMLNLDKYVHTSTPVIVRQNPRCLKQIQPFPLHVKPFPANSSLKLPKIPRSIQKYQKYPKVPTSTQTYPKVQKVTHHKKVPKYPKLPKITQKYPKVHKRQG